MDGQDINVWYTTHINDINNCNKNIIIMFNWNEYLLYYIFVVSAIDICCTLIIVVATIVATAVVVQSVNI